MGGCPEILPTKFALSGLDYKKASGRNGKRKEANEPPEGEVAGTGRPEMAESQGLRISDLGIVDKLKFYLG